MYKKQNKTKQNKGPSLFDESLNKNEVIIDKNNVDKT